jgi:hypothetical protein
MPIKLYGYFYKKKIPEHENQITKYENTIIDCKVLDSYKKQNIHSVSHF